MGIETKRDSERTRETITVERVNEVYIKLGCDKGTAQEISDYFTFEVPGAKFMPAYRNKYWDGKIRLFNVNTRQIYAGLHKHIEQFCEERDYTLEGINDLYTLDSISTIEAEEHFSSLPIKPRDYQIGAFAHAIRTSRAMILSPTASGKSLIIYMLCKYLSGRKLIIVPTTSLVYQMNTDFLEYSENQHNHSTHLIMSGQDKNADAEIFISTWQSIYKMPKKWFNQFDVVIGDEAHLFKAQSLTSIMIKLENCKYRFGFTGTLDGTQTHRLVLEGLFGPVMRVITTKELMDNNNVADLRIKGLVLKYSEATCKAMAKADYRSEIDFLISNEERNKFIKNLTLSRKGNTLLLYQMVEKHGQVLYDIINSSVTDRKVFFVHGKVSADERELVREITEKESDAIIIASYGTFSTGINIRNLHNIIFASPSKSRIRNLQSIGRGLRKGDNKDSATLYDIADDLSYKSWHNYTLKHFAVRVKMYNEEEFEYKIYNIRIKDESQSNQTPERRNNSLFDSE